MGWREANGAVRSEVRHLRREKLIEATIDTIARRGFRRTTLAEVARRARMSPGIVGFYFTGKDGLLLETLKFLAEEYEAQWRRAVAAAGPDPVARLEAIIETDLGREVCTRRKVSVWVAFWCEARSEPRFRRLCARLAEDYLAQTGDILAEIVERHGMASVDPKAVARGLNAMINGLWLELMIAPDHFDREAAKAACRAYLASFFPADFGEASQKEEIRVAQQ